MPCLIPQLIIRDEGSGIAALALASEWGRGFVMRVWPGRSYPLGATWDGAGVNFALFSENATKVELCLFDGPEAAQPSQTIALPERTNMVWHGYFPDVRPGQLYG